MRRSRDLLSKIESGASRGEPVAVVRVLNPASGNPTTVTAYQGQLSPPIPDRRITDEILSTVDRLIAKGGLADLIETADEQGTRVTLAVEIVRPKFELIVFGAGHVGHAVALIGALIGYDVTVLDDREEFASRRRLPDQRIRLVVCDYENATASISITTGTAVVIVTRGHQYDELCLKAVIRSNAGYVGMIGSRKRVLSVFNKLAGEGFSAESLARVHAPIGLRIGAVSPQEIAVSILAEIIDHLNNSGRKHKGERDAI